MKLLRHSVVAQFAVVTFVIMAAMAVMITAMLSSKIRSGAIEDLVSEAVGASEGRLLRTIVPGDLDVPMTGPRYEEFHDFVQRSVVSRRTARVKIWAKDGTVIYSNDSAAVGERFPTKKNLLKALRGENAIEIKVPKDPENERERYLGTLMEVYTPIVFPGSTEPLGAFEIYQCYEPTARRIAELRRWTYLSIGIGFLVLYASLVFIVWRGQTGIPGLARQARDYPGGPGQAAPKPVSPS